MQNTQSCPKIQLYVEIVTTSAKFRDESKPPFLALDILNIHELNLYLITLIMYSYFNNDLPEYFLNYFRLNENINSHDTRSASNIFTEFRRTNHRKLSLKCRGAQIWNNLPNILKISKTYRSFKKSAKVYVQSQTILHC